MNEIRGLWAIACQDLRRWRRRPLGVAGALLPPLGMALLLVVLSLTVTQEPVALVVQAHGPNADAMEKLIRSDRDAYLLTVTDLPNATRMLKDQEIAAIILIPPGFDRDVETHTASLQLTLNNVDIDFADDIRRSVDRSVGRFDARQLDLDTDDGPPPPNAATPSPAVFEVNPYHVVIDENDLRETNVSFLNYQVLPALVLLVLNVGLMGTALLCAQDAEQGTAKLLALAPMPAWALVAGRLLGGVLASLLALCPVLAVCVLTRVVSPPSDHWPALAALFVTTALCASGLGAILGTLLRGTRNMAMAASVLATYLFFLGGGFTTIAFLPQWLRTLSAFNPIRYAIDGMRQALFYPDLTGFPRDITILLATALVSVLIGSQCVRRAWKF